MVFEFVAVVVSQFGSHLQVNINLRWKKDVDDVVDLRMLKKKSW